jgi:CDP-diacylglycerol---glycerol-3-phosphate 3-phosphatidyltransferase
MRKAARNPSVLLKELWTLPNMLTLGRIVIIPFFIWLTYKADPLDSFLAAFLFTVAAVTDVIDGVLARRMHLVTVLGKFLDPLADKLIVMAALVMLVHLGRVAAWVVILVMAREFIVTGLRTIAMSEGLVIAAGREGKHKTAFQLAGISFLLLHYTYPIDAWAFTFDLDMNRVGTWLVYISLLFSVWSAVSYFQGFVRSVYNAEASAAGAAVPPGPPAPASVAPGGSRAADRASGA